MQPPVRTSFRIRDQTDAGFLIARAQLGDVILFKGGASSTERAIKRYQNIFSPHSFSASACEYVHAAIYIGGDSIIHAIPKQKGDPSGVVVDDVRQYSRGSHVTLLRWNGVSAASGAAIVANARTFLGTRYDYPNVFMQGVWAQVVSILGLDPSQALRWAEYMRDRAHYNRLYCSGFVLRAYIAALKGSNPLGKTRSLSALYTPAELFMTPTMINIDVP